MSHRLTSGVVKNVIVHIVYLRCESGLDPFCVLQYYLRLFMSRYLFESINFHAVPIRSFEEKNTSFEILFCLYYSGVCIIKFIITLCELINIIHESITFYTYAFLVGPYEFFKQINIRNFVLFIS